MGWGTLDGGSAPRHRARADERAAFGGASGYEPDVAPALTPEATGSLLKPGDLVWVKTGPGVVALGSGQSLTLAAPQTDRLYGWRQARIVDPSTLVAELVPVPAAPLRTAVGDDPMTVYQPPVAPTQRAPERAGGFPLGAGPNLHHLLDQRIAALDQQYRRMADDAQAQAQAQVTEANRQAREHVEESRRRAQDYAAQHRRWAEQEVARAKHEISLTEQASEQTRADLARYQSLAQRSAAQVSTLRMTAVALGALAALLLVAVLVMISVSVP